MAIIRAFKGIAPELGANVFVAESASVVGDVVLGEDVSIWYGAVLRGDVGKIRIGARSNIQDNATVHMTHQVSDAILGSDVIVGHNAVIHGAVIEDHVLIGMGALVMDNAVVESGAWIAAGSVVSPGTRIAAGMLARGIPAKPVRPVNDEERSWAAGGIARYLDLAREHQKQALEAG
jgi:carbonic anhydrase/acetyltransferase-like protein (isoleucine patch superfamily)